ncbi:hypothetical protein BJ742DRAFT_809837 [Cladochytrium replicatum]|nr:hypothetical protein BJ742DRAFT_809837 [Cladochytrium replicatum]
MGLYSAAQARAQAPPHSTTAAAESAQPIAPAAFNPTNAYIPPPTAPAPPPRVAPAPELPPAPIPSSNAPQQSPPVSPTPQKVGTFGRMFGKKKLSISSAQSTAQTLPGPQPGSRSAVGNSYEWFDAIQTRLQTTVDTNGLTHFYDPKAVNKLAMSVWNTVNVEQKARLWNLQVTDMLDLIVLALYDIVFYGDDSGSMNAEDGGRIKDLKYIVEKVTEIAVLFDDDGISVRFINSTASLDNCTSAQQIHDLFNRVEFNYGTPLGTQLYKKILNPLVLSRLRKLKKPVLVITITDGEPTFEKGDEIVKVIVQTKRKLEDAKIGAGGVAFQFAQVGTDTKAQAFLKMLDDHSEVGNLIDCTSAFELEQEECMQKGVDLTPEMWLLKLMCGAIDPKYDAKD